MKKQSLALACAVAGLVAACGGGSPSSQAPSFAAMVGSASGGGADVAATGTRWQSVKYGGSGYVPGLVFHPTSPNVLYARTDMGGVYRWDEAAATWTPITDGFGIREEFFNAFNTPQFDAPQGSVTATNFGAITGASGSRSVQLGLRLSF